VYPVSHRALLQALPIAGRRLLPGLDQRTAAEAAAILDRKRVTVWTETSVTAVEGPSSPYDDAPAGVRLADGRFVPAKTVIWTAGDRKSTRLNSSHVKIS